MQLAKKISQLFNLAARKRPQVSGRVIFLHRGLKRGDFEALRVTWVSPHVHDISRTTPENEGHGKLRVKKQIYNIKI